MQDLVLEIENFMLYFKEIAPHMAEFSLDVAYIASGVYLTLQLLLGSLGLGIVIGTFFAVLRYNGICTFIIDRIVSVLRGTPMILQLSFIYFGLPGLVGIKFTAIMAGILAFGLNSGAYISEILRAGIESLPKGQFEAAKTLQIPVFYMWRDIILPQVIRNVLPAMINEIIALLKETALIATIGGMDIMRKSQTLAAEQFTYFRPLCIAGACYYGMVLFVEYIGRKIEQQGRKS